MKWLAIYLCIAALTFILRNYFYLSTAVFWALFALAPTTVWFDTLFQGHSFKWKVLSAE